jgi:SPP1 gp7 family putative phage head morphogenesis protein
MSLLQNKWLYDSSTRLAIYVEAFKRGQVDKFDKLLRESDESLSRILWRLKEERISDLSRVQLNRLISSVRKAQSKVYSGYEVSLARTLRSFMEVDLDINRRIWTNGHKLLDEAFNVASIPSERTALKYVLANADSKQSLLGLAAISGTAGNSNSNKRLWSTLSNKPIPASGMSALEMIKHFSLVNRAAVENTIRRAWVEGWTVKQLNQELLGETAQGSSSVLTKTRNQSKAVVNTVIGETHNSVQNAVASGMFGRYVWISLMDDKTTEICRSRHMQIYHYGSGPIPPAHYNCRSHIAPLGSGERYQVDESLLQWVKRQPLAVKLNLPFTKFITLDEFSDSINLILSA